MEFSVMGYDRTGQKMELDITGCRYDTSITCIYYTRIITVCTYCLVIDLSETAHFGHWCGRNSNPVTTLPHTVVLFRMQPFNIN